MRMHRVMLLISVLVLAGAGITGYTLARSEPRLRAEPEASEAVAAEADNVRISDNATLRWEYEYEMCGHTVSVEAPVDDKLSGLTFTQLQQAVPDARIVLFETNEVVLRRSFPCYCPEHYILKQHEGELAVFCTKSGTDEQRVHRLVHIEFLTIDKGEQDVLTAGRVFDSIEDAEAYLTDILADGTQ